jgi:hypothetical protein
MFRATGARAKIHNYSTLEAAIDTFVPLHET